MKRAASVIQRELETWVADGLISPAQAEQIGMRYGSEPARTWLTVIALIGGVLCLGGVCLLIASNWQSIPGTVKLGGLLTLLAGAGTLAVETRRAGWSPAWWETSYLAAAVLPLLGIGLVSQTFHLDEPWHVIFGGWLVAVSALPVLSRSVSAFLVWLIAAHLWLASWLAGVVRLDRPEEFCLAFLAAGVAVAVASQAWLLVGNRSARAVGEFFGVFVAGLAAWGLGLFVKWWVLGWIVLALAALAWIGVSLHRGRPHQTTFCLVLVGLVIFSTFLRLAGSLLDTGLLFLAGGITLFVLALSVGAARRYLP